MAWLFPKNYRQKVDFTKDKDVIVEYTIKQQQKERDAELRKEAAYYQEIRQQIEDMQARLRNVGLRKPSAPPLTSSRGPTPSAPPLTSSMVPKPSALLLTSSKGPTPSAPSLTFSDDRNSLLPTLSTFPLGRSEADRTLIPEENEADKPSKDILFLQATPTTHKVSGFLSGTGWNVHKRLGAGVYGQAYAVSTAQDQQQVCIKVFQLEEVQLGHIKEDWFKERFAQATLMVRKNIECSAHRFLNFQHEVATLRGLSHANIVTFLDAFQVYYHQDTGEMMRVDGAEATPPAGYSLALGCIAQSLCDTTLFDLMNKTKKSLTEQQAVQLFRQIGQALIYLHSTPRFMTHNDVKPDNVGVCNGPNGSMTYKLLDFGICMQNTAEEYEQAQVESANYPAAVMGARENLTSAYMPFGHYRFLHVARNPNPFLRDNALLVYMVHWTANPTTRDGRPDEKRTGRRPIDVLMRHTMPHPGAGFWTTQRTLASLNALYP